MQFNAEKSLNNGNISQSYSQCVERISGIKDIFDFKVPEEVVRVRETRWDDFFERYSKEPCDDIDLNVDILEPGEEEEEEEESEEDNSFEQRLPVRVSSGLIQYWINTGNLPPCNRPSLPDGNVLLESGSSLSEKEPSLPERNADGRQKSKTDSSSVDTAVYILSNANVTKRADTIAIIAGVSNNVKVADCSSIKTIKNASNSKITCTVDHVVRGDKDITIQNSDFHSLSMVIASTITHNQLCNNADITDNIDLQSKEILSCGSTDKVNIPSQENAKTDGETSDGLAPNEVLERDSLCKEQSSINVTNEGENTNPLFHRKKLYTGRDSPIDLLQTKVHNINRLSKITDVLHPALTPNDIVEKKSSKCKNKSLFNEHFLNSDASQRLLKPIKKKVRKKRSSVKNIAGKKVTNKIRDSDRSPKYPPESRDSGKRDSTRSRGRNDTDISTKDKTSKPDLTSVNLNPVVVLTRSRLCNSGESKCVGDINAHENMRDNGRSHETGKLRARAIENLDEETTIESDDNTVILICECKTSASLGTLFSDNCAAKSRVSGKRVTVQKTRSSNSCGEGATSDVRLRELRVVLERLSALKNYTSAAKSSGVSRKGDTVQQKVASTTKLPEAKVMLERLPSDVYHKRGYNSATKKNSSIPPDNANNRENRNKRRKYAIISSSDENSEPTRPSRKRSKTSANAKASRKTRDIVRKLHAKTTCCIREKVACVFDGSEKDTETCEDEAHLSMSESNNNDPGKVNGNEKRSSFFEYSTDANDDASCSDTTEKNGTRCKNDVGIVLFQTRTYETDSSDSEIYNPSARKSFSGRHISVDSSSLSPPDKEQRIADRTRSTSLRSATGEEESHDIDNFDITDSNKVQSMSLLNETSCPSYRDSLVNISRKKEQFDRSEMVKVSQQNSVKSTAVKSLVFQTKTYYDSDSSD